MPATPRPGKKGVYVELPESLDAEFRAFVDGFPLGSLTQHIILAMRRHMATPPVVTVKPLATVDMSSASVGGHEKPARKGGKK